MKKAIIENVKVGDFVAIKQNESTLQVFVVVELEPVLVSGYFKSSHKFYVKGIFIQRLPVFGDIGNEYNEACFIPHYDIVNYSRICHDDLIEYWAGSRSIRIMHENALLAEGQAYERYLGGMQEVYDTIYLRPKKTFWERIKKYLKVNFDE